MTACEGSGMRPHWARLDPPCTCPRCLFRRAHDDGDIAGMVMAFDALADWYEGTTDRWNDNPDDAA